MIDFTVSLQVANIQIHLDYFVDLFWPMIYCQFQRFRISGSSSYRSFVCVESHRPWAYSRTEPELLCRAWCSNLYAIMGRPIVWDKTLLIDNVGISLKELGDQISKCLKFCTGIEI